MPYDFYYDKIYKIDYDKVFNNLVQNKILRDSKKNQLYIHNWINALKSADYELVERAKKPFAKYMLLEVFESNFIEVFGYDINFDNTFVRIQFNIPVIEKRIKDNSIKNQKTKLSVKQILSSGDFSYTFEKLPKDYSPSHNPLIIIEANHETSYIVIDGNHRLTHAVSNNYELLSCCIIDAREVINTKHNFFPTYFDKLFYVMIIEFNCFLYYQNNFTDDEIIEKSYAKTGRFIF